MGIGEFFNNVPGIGHAIGLYYYSIDEKEKGDHAMNRATRTTLVAGAGIGGFIVGAGGFVFVAPILAGVAGIETGVFYDGVHSLIAREPRGIIKDAKEYAENPTNENLIKFIQQPIIDASVGVFVGGMTVPQPVNSYYPQNLAQTRDQITSFSQEYGSSISLGITVTKLVKDQRNECTDKKEKFPTREKLRNLFDIYDFSKRGSVSNYWPPSRFETYH